MRNLLLNSVMSLTFAAAAFSFVPAAPAQDFELEIGRDGPTIRLDDRCNPRYENCGGGRWERDGGRREEFRRGCTEGRALDKAERMGVRRARVESAGRRVIEVRGRDRRGDRVLVAFGRAPSCPILR